MTKQTNLIMCLYPEPTHLKIQIVLKREKYEWISIVNVMIKPNEIYYLCYKYLVRVLVRLDATGATSLVNYG